MLSTFLYKGTSVSAQENTLGIDAGAAIIIDAETGKILYQHNIDELMGVASMSKMLTEYLVLEAIHEGKITWDQEVLISEFIHRLSVPYVGGPSTVGLTQGETYTVKELYETMAIHSANASTVALAELIAGTETNFVKLMREKAEELQLENYHFVNSSGLNNSSMLGNYPEGTGENEENEMSARATARLAYHLLKDYPEVLDTASISRLDFRGVVYPNFNFMLPGLSLEYPGVDGLKTGSTEYAQYNFTATAERNGQRFITVVMRVDERNKRFHETRKLLDYAFATFGKQEIFPKGMTVEGYETLPVNKGKEDAVGIATKDSLSLVIKHGDEDQYVPKLELNKDLLNEAGELVAPVEKGQVVGYLTYEYQGGTDYGFIEPGKTVQVEVIATESVEKAGWFSLMLKGIGGFFANLWGSITSTIGSWF